MPGQARATTVADNRDAVLGTAFKALFRGDKTGAKRLAKSKQITATQLVHLLRRLLICAAAIRYMTASVQSSVASLKVIRGMRNAPLELDVYRTDYILPWAGSSTIRASPLVTQLLQDDTTPRNYTIYLEANSMTSTAGCATPLFNKALYGNTFLRGALGSIQRDGAYNISELATHQLVAPVVDCSFAPLVRGLTTTAFMFFVMRGKLDADDALLLAVRFSMQDYKVVEMSEFGATGFSSQQSVRDMRAPTVLHTTFTNALGYPFQVASSLVYTAPVLNDQAWWETAAIPPKATVPPKRVITSRRTGFFISSDNEQANINHQYWTVDTDPALALSRWRWVGEPKLKDSWAWVHFLHVGFAFSSLVNLLLLLLVVYRNFQKGRVWVGDAFVVVSSSLLVRGALILASWFINGYWSLMEFCLHDAHTLARTQMLFLQDNIMQADLLTLFLATAAVLGHVLRERIDPALAVTLFEITFECRLRLLQWFPSIHATVTSFVVSDLQESVLGVNELVAATSPLRLWTVRELAPRQPRFILACLSPFGLALVLVMCFVVARKLYRRAFREKVYVQGSKHTAGTAVSSQSDEATLLYKRNLTLFEIATGVELQTSYGVMSEYENFIYIKGMKYASADGIYSSGFVVANDRFLVPTEDWLVVVLQKLTKTRVKNVYIYAIQGNTVQQEAQLVYADTLTWDDLFHLNVTILS